MLRFSYLPSDFNPMLLVLGDQPNLRAFAGWLRVAARDGDMRHLEAAPFCRPGDTSVALELTARSEGLVVASSHDKRLTWRVETAHALAFADLVDALIAGGRRSGSDALVCGLVGEIPVKVSHGEFTDDFLVSNFP